MASTAISRRASASAGGEDKLVRFDRVERFAHWANALLFAILIATALPLYFPSIEALVGRRALVEEIHLYAGLSLPVPLCISLAGRWGARFRRDVRRFCLWSRAEVAWLRTFGRTELEAPDKFNPGQKLNALVVAGTILVMFATGCMLKWFSPFSLSWRTGATFVHDVGAFAIVAVIVGHVAMALAHPEALRSMFTGRVSTSWARRHAAGWLEEERPSNDEQA